MMRLTIKVKMMMPLPVRRWRRGKKSTMKKYTLKKTLKGHSCKYTPAVYGNLLISGSHKEIKIWTLEGNVGSCVKTIEIRLPSIIPLHPPRLHHQLSPRPSNGNVLWRRNEMVDTRWKMREDSKVINSTRSFL